MDYLDLVKYTVRQLERDGPDKLTGEQWSLLLISELENGRFSKQCDFSKLNYNDWMYVVQFAPHYKNHPMYKLKML